MIGGASGGLYAGLTNTHRFATGSSGLPAVLLYIGDDTMKFFWNIIIALIISAAVTAVLTYVLSFKYEKDEITDVPEIKPIILEDTRLISPIHGTVIPLSQVQDEAFASEALGKGFAINPSEGEVFAPFNGKVVAVFPTKHAIGLMSDSGMEILIHVGLNTVELNGQYFDALVEPDQPVTKGQLLLTFDVKKIEAAGYPTQVPVVVTNTPQYSSIEMIKQGDVNKDEEVLVVKV
jgi:PTS system beta-glucosides-specific IIC component